MFCYNRPADPMHNSQMWWNSSAFLEFHNASTSSASMLSYSGFPKHLAPALALCVLISLRFVQLCAPNYRWLCRRVSSKLHAYAKIRRRLCALDVVADNDSGARSVPGVLGVGAANAIYIEFAKSPSFPLLEILVEDKVVAPMASLTEGRGTSTAAASPESEPPLRCKLGNRTGLVRNRSSTALFMV